MPGAREERAACAQSTDLSSAQTGRKAVCVLAGVGSGYKKFGNAFLVAFISSKSTEQSYWQ